MIQNGLYGLGFIRVGNEPVTVRCNKSYRIGKRVEMFRYDI